MPLLLNNSNIETVYYGTDSVSKVYFNNNIVFQTSISYDPDASALFARMSVEPSSGQKEIYNTAIAAMKTAGLWSLLDCFYMMGVHDAQAARLNWISTSFNLTEFNSPTFTQNQGYNGNGSTSYLGTNFNPTTAPSAKHTQNSAHLGCWILASAASTNMRDIGNGTNTTYLVAETDTNGVQSRINATAAVSVGSIGGVGAWVLRRNASNTHQLFKNGSQVGTNSNTSTALANENITLLRGSASTYSTRQQYAAHIGAGLSDQQIEDFFTIINNFYIAWGNL